MDSVLLTGGAGFFGEILKKRLLDDGFHVVNIDLVPDESSHPNLVSLQVDIRDTEALKRLFDEYTFTGVFHCAAMLAHAIKDKQELWDSNVTGTRNLVELTKAHGIRKFIFTSTNCLWAHNFHRPVTEDDVPSPQEVYGESKAAAERVLLEYADDVDVVILRTPTIIDYGRLGLLAILFDFILDGKKIYVVGSGDNEYQFIFGPDLADACVKALNNEGSDIYNVGSDDVKSLREVFQYVVDNAQTGSRVVSLPKRLTLLGMRIGHILKVSPLGPYHYKMISEDFMFDTSKIKSKLGWAPTLSNSDMLYRAYEYYKDNIDDIRSRTDVSAHKQAAKMGILKLLKWIS